MRKFLVCLLFLTACNVKMVEDIAEDVIEDVIEDLPCNVAKRTCLTLSI